MIPSKHLNQLSRILPLLCNIQDLHLTLTVLLLTIRKLQDIQVKTHC